MNTAIAQESDFETEVMENQVVFRDLALSEEVQLSIQMAGYVTPTPVQTQIIPYLLDGRDVLAQSQTGTGKTAAFALPILSRIDINGPQPQVLVLAPTRELATQVAKSFETYSSCLPKLRIAAVYGGADYEPQLRSLKRGVHIVVGTPGRIIDHIRRGTLRLDTLRCLVLDEADEMLNMGFAEDVEFILSQTPPEKQVALFSATMPDPIRRIADQYLKDPATITIKKRTLTNEAVRQRCVFVNDGDKLELLARMLEVEDTDGVIVFTKTKDATIHVAERLISLGIRAAALNGDLPQARRQRAVDQLKSGVLDVIVATDVAARGLDVQRISHVFNFDLPHDGESYVHRIGRTGRAGRSGEAIIFLTPKQRGKLRLIEKVTKQAIEVTEAPTARQINLKRAERFKTQLTATIAAEDLGPFKNVVSQYAAETGEAWEVVAAALAFQAQGGRPMFVKDMPKRPLIAQDDRRPERGRSEKFGQDRGRDSRGPGRDRPVPAGMLRYRLSVGAADGAKPGNIVGAVANEVGIPGSDIGPILIRDSFSTIDLPDNLSSDVIDQIGRTWVAGRQLSIRPYTERGPAPRAGGRFDGPPRGAAKRGKPRFDADARSAGKPPRKKFKGNRS